MSSPKKESCLSVSNPAFEAAFAFDCPASAPPQPMPMPIPESVRLAPRASRSFAERLVVISLLCDSAIIFYALLAGFWLRFCTKLDRYGVISQPDLSDYIGYIVFGALSLTLSLAYFQIYERQKLLHFRSVVIQIIKASVLWYVGFLGFSLMFKFQPPISRIFVSISAGNALVLLIGWRWLFHGILVRSNVAASLRQRILIVGWNDEAERLTRNFDIDPTQPYEVVGCVLSAGLPQPKMKPTVRVLGLHDDIAKIIQRQSVDMVILADLNIVKGEIIGLANLCEKEMVQFKVIPSYFQIFISGLQLETVTGIPVLGVSQLPLDRTFNVVAKRLVDIVGGLVGFIASVPIMLIFGTIVYWESPGPIFYRQRRMGRNGVPFHIIKIRSMRLDAESGTGACWAQKDDPRRLRIGAFMREWNVDEVPQFINVLRGEMSLVGPRPERPELIENFKQDIPHYNARHNVKPGITGWAQVKGLRGDTDLTERIRADLFYLENWNTLLDLQIMFLTFFKRDNAY